VAFAGGQHRRHEAPAGPPPDRRKTIPVTVLPAGGDLTVDELRGFLADVDMAAEEAGTNPGGLRVRAACRASATVKGIWVNIPVRRDGNAG
jgi:hypothetical protein